LLVVVRCVLIFLIVTGYAFSNFLIYIRGIAFVTLRVEKEVVEIAPKIQSNYLEIDKKIALFCSLEKIGFTHYL